VPAWWKSRFLLSTFWYLPYRADGGQVYEWWATCRSSFREIYSLAPPGIRIYLVVDNLYSACMFFFRFRPIILNLALTAFGVSTRLATSSFHTPPSPVFRVRVTDLSLRKDWYELSVTWQGHTSPAKCDTALRKIWRFFFKILIWPLVQEWVSWEGEQIQMRWFWVFFFCYQTRSDKKLRKYQASLKKWNKLPKPILLSSSQNSWYCRRLRGQIFDIWRLKNF